MAQETTLDYIPENVSEQVKQKILELAKESEPHLAPLQVNEYFIRHWCETVEDGNPLYLDEEYARSRGFRGLVAPPGSIGVSAVGFRWPWPPKGHRASRAVHFEMKRLLNLPVAIIANQEIEYYRPIQVGDRLSTSDRLVSISAWKQTRVGEGHFWTWATAVRNQTGELVAEQRHTAFGYGRGEAGAETPEPKGGYSNTIEEAIEGEKTGYQPPPPRDLYWEDVREGEELPSIVMPINLTRCAYLASGTRDFSPQHSNRDYAQQRSKTRDVFVNTPFNQGMVGRFVTDWGGPTSTIRRMMITMRGSICPGDDMIMNGSVIRKYVQDGEHRVDIDIMISTQDGPATPCEATLALPSRGGGGKGP
jgi:acyl dehydratase